MGLGCFPFARHYSGNHYCFLFLCLLRCFSSAGLRIYATSLQLVRFPHSEIRGSIHICWSPRLIAAYHVLHRLWEPRHPPCTLSYFLLLITLLLVIVCFLIWLSLRYTIRGSKTINRSLSSFLFSSSIQSQQPSLLLSSLFFNYFFQYVKERLPRSIPAPLSISNSFQVLEGVVENNGFEPLTPCVQGRCSSQLS